MTLNEEDESFVPIVQAEVSVVDHAEEREDNAFEEYESIISPGSETDSGNEENPMALHFGSLSEGLIRQLFGEVMKTFYVCHCLTVSFLVTFGFFARLYRCIFQKCFRSLEVTYFKSF